MKSILELNLRRISPSIVQRASREIVRGGVILYPTETIYGLGCSAYNEEGIDRIFEIKRRSEQKPMLVLVRNRTMLDGLVSEIPPIALKLMKHFWPGPLTILLKARERVPRLLTAGTGKVGVRIPNSRFCMKVLELSDTPIVSTSANISGRKTFSDVELLKKTFAGKIELIIDAGNLPSSPPSTVVDVWGNGVAIVRSGAISNQQLHRFLTM